MSNVDNMVNEGRNRRAAEGASMFEQHVAQRAVVVETFDPALPGLLEARGPLTNLLERGVDELAQARVKLTDTADALAAALDRVSAPGADLSYQLRALAAYQSDLTKATVAFEAAQANLVALVRAATVQATS